jgi:hypothetical protein
MISETDPHGRFLGLLDRFGLLKVNKKEENKMADRNVLAV